MEPKRSSVGDKDGKAESVAINISNNQSQLQSQSPTGRKSTTFSGDTKLLPSSSSQAHLELPGEELSHTEWHFMEVDQAANRLRTNIDIKDPRRSQGLTSQEAKNRLAFYGLNQLTPPKQTPKVIMYLKQYINPLMVLLLVAGILCLIAYAVNTAIVINLWLAIVLFVVTFISCTYSYFQEGSATEVMQMFKKMLAKSSRVIRDGREMVVPSTELVPGDLVLLAMGDFVPCDTRIISASEFKVEVSSLTGESTPISATVAVPPPGTTVEESRNVVFNTSQCVEGEAIGLCVSTGDASYIGNIAKLASATTTVQTPLEREVMLFVKRLTIFSVCLGLIFFIVGGIQQGWTAATFINCFVLIIVDCVPEGLPMTVVSCLAISAKRLAARNVFVKELKSVETLGSATVIATDKTGTLTQNKMSVTHLWYDGAVQREEVAIREHVGGGVIGGDIAHRTLGWLDIAGTIVNRTHFDDEKVLSDEAAEQLEACVLLNQLDPSVSWRSASASLPMIGNVRNDLTMRTLKKSYQIPDDSKRSVVGGDASDTAIFNFLRKRYPPELMRYAFQVIFEQPFNSRNKFALKIVKPRKAKQGQKKLSHNARLILIKGAPEVILAKCAFHLLRGQVKPIDQDFRNSFTQAYELFGNQGERVLGFAQMELDEKEYPPEKDHSYAIESLNWPQNGYTFIGLMSLIDPPRPGVAEAVAEVRGAGVKVIMVTGDHPLTAASIARQVGILTGPIKQDLDRLDVHQGDHPILKDMADFKVPVDAIVVTGTELSTFDINRWNEVLGMKEIVFARTTPSQKLSIVEHLQRLEHVVAVTGDGVNDSPALKKAQIGVAMGSGSDVAKGAGDIIIMDDNFSSIVQGIREGRTIFDNLRKTIAYTCVHLIPELMPTLLNLAYALPQCMSGLQVLSIDCGTELAPAISFAYEPSEKDVMKYPPRDNKKDRLVSWSVIAYIFTAGLIEAMVTIMAFYLFMRSHGLNSADLNHAATNYFPSTPCDTTVYPDLNSALANSSTPPMITHAGVAIDCATQQDLLLQGETVVWVGIVLSQVVHIWFVKTHSVPVWEHGIFNNLVMWFGVLIELLLMLVLIYVPVLGSFFGNEPFYPTRYWALFLLSALALCLINEPRKLITRKYPNSFVARYLAW